MSDDAYELREYRAAGLAAAGRTHVGTVRALNEDTLICEPERLLFAVIDGMGGAQAGEVAAALTRESLLESSPDSDLRQALGRANETVHERAAQNARERGMGCVATAARVESGELLIAHVGDTRAFLASEAGFEQLTRDHTVVADIQEQQGMTDTRASMLPGQHEITRDIGGKLHADLDWIDTVRVPFRVGDLFLLCSDGLSAAVARKELFGILAAARREQTPVLELVNRLVELALERGARDNVSVVAVRREKAPPKSAKPKAASPSLGPGGGFAMVAGRGKRRETARRVLSKIVLVSTLAAAFLAGVLTSEKGWLARLGFDAAPATAQAGIGEDGEPRTSEPRGNEVRPDPELTIQGASLAAAPAADGAIVLGVRGRIVLRRLSIRDPELVFRVEFADAQGHLVFEDCDVEVGRLKATAPKGALIEFQGGRFSSAQNPVLEGVDLLPPADSPSPAAAP